jgi:DNA-binding NarL/FixJ family response regulator
MDGSAFHAARQAIELARKRRLQGGLFVGFGETDDLVLNGFARLLRHVRQELTRGQMHTLTLLRQGRTQAQIAKELRLTPQAVSKRAKGAGWEALLEGERGWAAALKPFDVAEEWEERPR